MAILNCEFPLPPVNRYVTISDAALYFVGFGEEGGAFGLPDGRFPTRPGPARLFTRPGPTPFSSGLGFFRWALGRDGGTLDAKINDLRSGLVLFHVAMGMERSPLDPNIDDFLPGPARFLI